ncbi:MAG TPA: thioredoxin family protein [Opitutales bacterium]|jgi:protein disulfide-isomerase|nr:thioredoxin family protein [Opitutales bacterium]
MRDFLKILANVAAMLAMFILAACGGSSASSSPATWLTNQDQAAQIAGQEQRLIFIAFVGSDWSVTSQDVMKNVFDTKEFQDFANDKLVLLRIDLKRGAQESDQVKQQYDALAKSASIDHLPTLLLFDPFHKQLLWRSNGYGAVGPAPLIQELGNIVTQWQQHMAEAQNAPQNQTSAAPQLPTAQAPGAPVINGMPSASAQDLARQQALQGAAMPNALSATPSAPSGLPGAPSAQELMRQIQQGPTPTAGPTPEQLLQQIQTTPAPASVPASASTTDSAFPTLK